MTLRNLVIKVTLILHASHSENYMNIAQQGQKKKRESMKID